MSTASEPIPMLLWCPACGERHHDVGEYATKPHHTHACQDCGMVWRPAIVPTVGVFFLPGFKNETPSRIFCVEDGCDAIVETEGARCMACSVSPMPGGDGENW